MLKQKLHNPVIGGWAETRQQSIVVENYVFSFQVSCVFEYVNLC